MRDFRREAEALRDSLVAQRRDFHRHPELAFQEVRTAGIVAGRLQALGLEVQTGIGQTGVVGMLDGSADGPTVMVRCDMDALPVHEETGAEYRSETERVMHACGHDGHTSVGLAVAQMLAARREEIAGRVKFVFQPAEEVGKGALAMIEDGVLSDPAPHVALGLHLWNELPVGEVALTSGPFMAGGDKFDVTISGQGGHGAMPDLTIDPVMTAAHIITALQTIVSRNVNPLDTAVVSVTRVQAGDAYNVIPSVATLAGTIRSFKQEVRQLILERFETIVLQTAAALGCEAAVGVTPLSVPVVNDPDVTERLRGTIAAAAPGMRIRDDLRTMAAEDMAYFLQRVPGTYFFVGSAPRDGQAYPHHHPKFDIAEDALVDAAALLATAVASYVLKG